MDFTIITPSYNYSRYIAECLKSVADQDEVTFEHLVMDACSTDNTSDVVAKFPHAQFFQEPDKGMSDGINKGFLKAKGKWVMWLNADDRLKPGALKAVKDFAENLPNTDVIFGGWDFMDADGNPQKRITAVPFDFRMLIQHGCYIGSTSCFYRRATTIDQGFLLDVEFKFCMDGEYYARLAAAGKRFLHMPMILADFRLHDQSISQGHLRKKDLHGILSLQRQAAEPRSLRRFYGFKPFKDENLNLIIDGILYHIYRIKKGLLRLWLRRKCQGVPLMK
jgi:glycosyltransferase involved in cell wall biosynthesis